VPLQSYSAADMILAARARLEKPLLWLIFLGTTTFCLIEMNLFYLGACWLAIGVNYYAVARNQEVYVDRLWVNLCGVLSLVLVLVEYRIRGRAEASLLEVVGHFLILVQLCKLFVQKRARDYAQLIALNIMLMITAALLSAGMLFSVVCVVYIALASYVGLVYTLKRGLDQAAESRLRSESAPLEAKRVAWNVVRSWPGKSLRKMLWAMYIPSVLVGVAAFLLAPRAQEALVRTIGDQMPMAAGRSISSSMRISGPKELYQSDRVALRVRIRRGEDYGPAPAESAQYLRLQVLDRYRDSTWDNDRPQRFRRARLVTIPGSSRFDWVVHEISLVPNNLKLLPVPFPTAGLDGLPPELATTISQNLEFAALTSGWQAANLEYQTKSFLLPLSAEEMAYLRRRFGEIGRPKDDPLADTVFQSPDVRGRIESLARDWCEDLLRRRENEPAQRDALNLDIANRLAQQLRANYSYSLNIDNADPLRDGVDDFLFHLKAGHCEYFASALAIMCRILDVQARVATGYYISEYDSDKQMYIVRDRNAHAWTEVYTPATNWVIVDATPAGQMLSLHEVGFWGAMKRLWEDARFFWYENIVGYDNVQKRKLGQNLADWASETLRSLKTDGWAMLRKTLATVGVALGVVVMLAALVVLGYILAVRHGIVIPRRRRVRGGAHARQRQLEMIRMLLDRLSERGVVCGEGTTLREFLFDARDRLRLPAGPVEELLTLQYQWRWGNVSPSEAQLDAAETNFQAVMDCLVRVKFAPAEAG
jgi:transglutaminase-like putative cysteine protease